MVASKHLGNTSIIIVEGDSKVIIECYNKKINLPSSIILLIKDI